MAKRHLEQYDSNGNKLEIFLNDDEVKVGNKTLAEKLDEIEEEIDGAGGYEPPQEGIPASDLAGDIPKDKLSQGVQDSLGKADSAIQGVTVNNTSVTPDGNKKVNITVPTKTSDLDNDSDFVTQDDLPEGVSVDTQLADSGNPIANRAVNFAVNSLQTAINSLQSALDTLIGSGNVQGAIDTFNEVTAFLNGIDTSDPTLKNQLLALETAISNLQSALESKANANNVYSKNDADGRFVQSISVNGTPQTKTSGNVDLNVQGIKGDDGKSAYDTYYETTSDNPKKTPAQWAEAILRSAYQSYLATTSDDPVLTEAAWLLTLKGEKGDAGDTLLVTANTDVISIIVNDLITGGSNKILSAQMGKVLKILANAALYSGEGNQNIVETVILDASDFGGFVIGNHAWGSNIGYAKGISSASNRATGNDLISNNLPLEFDVYIPVGYKVGFRWFNSSGGPNSSPYPFVDFVGRSGTGVVDGWLTINNKDKTTYVWCVPVFRKDDNSTDGGSLSSPADIDALEAEFKLRYVASQETANVGSKVISIVGDSGDEVLGLSSPSSNGEATKVYSKEAVDNIVQAALPPSGDSNYRVPKAGVEVDAVIEQTFNTQKYGRAYSGTYGIATTSNATGGKRATQDCIFYIGEGNIPTEGVPSGLNVVKFDVSKWVKFIVPTGFYASPTVQASLTNGASYAYPTDWQTGEYELTPAQRTQMAGYNWMAFNIKKASSASGNGDVLDDTDIAKLSSGFKMVYEQEATSPSECAIEIVNADNTSVKKIFNGEDKNKVQLYSKSAIDTMIGGIGFASERCRRVLRVCHWNVGQFALGQGGVHVGELLSTNYVKKWQNKLHQIGADVMLMCEFYNDANSQNHRVEEIFADYPFQNIERKSGSGDYIWSAIMSNIALTNVERVDFNNESSRNFLAATITIGTWSITLIECHLYFAANDNGTKRGEQMQQIIDYCANIDRVIIAGDFNNVNIAEFDVFKQAGYQMFNRDLYDRVNTYPATGIVNSNYTPQGLPSIAIDNIMCKGLTIVGAQVVDDGTLTDHCGVVCDLILEDLS